MTRLRPDVLSEEANERIFREQIVPRFFTDAPAQDRPVLVIVGGQTGSGKTAATTMVKRALSMAGGFVTIDMDLYNPRHPAW
ncbi:MAG: zeta toxin family protein, partial [Dermatophilaceae bacterium]